MFCQDDLINITEPTGVLFKHILTIYLANNNMSECAKREMHQEITWDS